MWEAPRRDASAPASCYSHSNLISPVGFNDFCFRSVEGGGETYEVFFACSNDLVMVKLNVRQKCHAHSNTQKLWVAA